MPKTCAGVCEGGRLLWAALRVCLEGRVSFVETEVQVVNLSTTIFLINLKALNKYSTT